MTEPAIRLDEMQAAMANPTWRLLQQKWAHVILTVLAPLYERAQSTIPADEFHNRAAGVFRILRERGVNYPVDADDAKSVRDECKSWVEQDKWLERHGEADGEVYRLTPEAREAILIVRRLDTTRAAMSESQVAYVLEAARRLALSATSDPETRMRQLREDIEEQERRLEASRAELAALEAGGAVEVKDDYEIFEDYLRLRSAIDELPNDLKQVEDAFRSLAGNLREQFWAETRRPTGEMVSEYLRKADELSVADRYGRGFQQAKGLLTHTEAQDRLRLHFDIIEQHPFAEQLLNDRDRAELRRTMHMITDSVAAVLDQRDAMTSSLVKHITSRNPLREKELDKAIREAQIRLRQWAIVNKIRSQVALPISHATSADPEDATGPHGPGAGVADIRTLRTKPHRRRRPTALVSLAESSGGEPPEFSIDELRSRGGPFYSAIADALTEEVAAKHAVGAADAFNRLPDSMRRPADIMAVLDYAARQYAIRTDVPDEQFDAVATDGTPEPRWLPTITLVATDSVEGTE